MDQQWYPCMIQAPYNVFLDIENDMQDRNLWASPLNFEGMQVLYTFNICHGLIFPICQQW